MAIIEPIRITGLRELQASLKAMDGEAQKELRVALNEAAEIVVKGARQRMPSRSGKARASVKVASGQREAKVKFGSAKTPYTPWLDFGGRVGRNKSISRPVLRHGRYVYVAYDAQRHNIQRLLEKRLSDLIDRHHLGRD
jgi:hypothetical protein